MYWRYSWAVGSPEQGMKWAILVRRSTMIHMWPFEHSRSVIKYTEMDLWRGQGLQDTSWFAEVVFGPSIDLAGFHILGNIRVHP